MEPFQFTFAESRSLQLKNSDSMLQLEREKRKELQDKEWERFLANIVSLDKLNNKRKSYVSPCTGKPQNHSQLQPTASSSSNRLLTIVDCYDSIDYSDSLINSDSEQYLSPIYEETRNVSDDGLPVPVSRDESNASDEYKLVSLTSFDRPGYEDNIFASLNSEHSLSCHQSVNQPIPLVQNNNENNEFNSNKILDCQPASNAEDTSLETVPKKIDRRMRVFSFEHRERIKTFWSKIKFCLDKILYLLDKTPKPEDIKDDTRRRKRAAEFSVLFGRNHLYPLGRKLQALNDEVNSATFRELGLPVGKRLVEAHQYAASALAAYANHMPTSVVMGLPDKLRALLNSIVDLCVLCRRLKMTTVADDGDGHKAGFELIKEKSKQLAKEVDKQEEKAAEIRLARLRYMDSMCTKLQPKKHMLSKFSPYSLPLPFTQLYRRPIKKLARNKWDPPRRDPKQLRGRGASTTNCTVGTNLARRRHPHYESRIATPFEDSDNVVTMMDVIAEREREAKRKKAADPASRKTVSDVNLAETANPPNVLDRAFSDTSLCTQSRPSTGFERESIDDRKTFKKLFAKVVKERLSQQQRTFGVKNAQLVILPKSQTPENHHISSKENSNRYANQKSKKRSSTKLTEHVSAERSPPLTVPNTETSRSRARDESKNQMTQTCDQKVKPRVFQPNGLRQRCGTLCEEESDQTTSTLASESISHVKQDVHSRILPSAQLRRSKNKPEPISTTRQTTLVHNKSLLTLRQDRSSNREEISVIEYKKRYKDYTKGLLVYRQEFKPWTLIANLATDLTVNSVTDRVKEFQIESLVSSLCKLELQ